MVFKINVSHKGKAFKVESEGGKLVGASIGDKIDGKEISDEDKAGFTGMENIDGPNLHKALLGYGKGMHKRPKGEKKVNKKPNGLRLRKTVRGKEISSDTVQINSKVIKEGAKKFDTLFIKKEEPSEAGKPEEKPVEEKKE